MRKSAGGFGHESRMGFKGLAAVQERHVRAVMEPLMPEGCGGGFQFIPITRVLRA